MIRFFAVLASLLAISCGHTASAAERVALVIGNASYEHAAALANPRNDAAAMTAQLKNLGFVVVEVTDAGLYRMLEKIDEFVGNLDHASLAIFYYAGHGLQVNGRNYIIPIDASLESAIRLDYEAIPIDLIITSMQEKVETNLVFLDACRDNPLASILSRSLGTRSTLIGRGLARVGVGTGTLVSFATEPGNVAQDGTGQNSPYTAALVKHLGTPGESISDSMIRVRQEVIATTGGRQVPWEHSSLTGRVVLQEKVDRSAPPEVKLVNPTESTNSIETTFWNSIQGSKSKAYFQSYLEQYPSGVFSRIAILKIEEFDNELALSLTQGSLDGTDSHDPSIQAELVRKIQSELNRLGCSVGNPDGVWGSGSKSGLEKYAQKKERKLASYEPSPSLLESLAREKAVVCPLVCRRGFELKTGVCVSKKTITKKPQPADRSQKAAEPTRSTSQRATTAATRGRCRDGNVAQCRVNCKAGRRGACDMLRRLGG